MPIDTSEPRGRALELLARRLLDRQERLARLDAYFRGEQVLHCTDPNMNAAFREFQKRARSNFAELIVEAPRERMIPVGFRTSEDADASGDREAWRIWQRADLDIESAEVHQWMLALGEASVIVGPPEPDTGVPLITAEDPRQVITASSAARPRVATAALKMFHDPDADLDLAYLYLPGEVHVATAARKTRRGSSADVRFSANRFDWDEERSSVLPEALAGVVPVVRFQNRRGVGEFETHMDLLDRINHTILQRMWVTVMQAFRQRAAIGLPKEDENGNIIDYDGLFVADPGAFWQLPPGATMWESGQADLTPILSSVKDDVTHLAAVTRTPLPYLTPDAATQSAEGAALQREGLVFKTEDRIKRATSGWKQVMSLAFRYIGDDKRADLDALEVMWTPPDRPSLAERYDAASKAGPAGVPWRTRMRDILGFPPDQLDQMEAERADDELLAPELTSQRRAATAPSAGA